MLAGGQHMRLTDPARLLLFYLRFSRWREYVRESISA
jgi:hypothetical protein